MQVRRYTLANIFPNSKTSQSYQKENEFAMLINTNRKNNIVNSLIPEEFKEYIMKKIDENEQECAIKKKMEVPVVSEFYNLFNKSKLMLSTILS